MILVTMAFIGSTTHAMKNADLRRSPIHFNHEEEPVELYSSLELSKHITQEMEKKGKYVKCIVPHCVHHYSLWNEGTKKTLVLLMSEHLEAHHKDQWINTDN